VPDFPLTPREPPRLDVVPDALLTAVRQGPLRTVQPPLRWLRGAVHDAEGRLLPASQKIGGLGGNQGAMADPRRVPVPAHADRLEGTWLYGGHWIHHFGHFVTETVTTLWPDPAELRGGDDAPRGVVFHAYFGGYQPPQPWQEELLGLTGYGDLPVEVVHRAPVRVERLLLPGRSVVVNGWAHPEARDVWRRMAAATGASTMSTGPTAGGPRRWLSRTAFNDARRAANEPTRTSAARDRELDAVFAAAGFEVVTPEALPLPDQLRLAATSSVLAGGAGTALHLSAFAPAGVRVLEVGDERSPGVQVPHQLVIDALCQHPSAFVPHATPAADLAARLAALGVG
jgi:capsular polysaccharide biosynthesis protein